MPQLQKGVLDPRELECRVGDLPSLLGVELMLEVSLARLYRAIATWRPPGRGVALSCLSCLRSPFRDAAALAPLPEEVVHDFLRDLDTAVRLRLIDLRDEREADYAQAGLEWESDEEPDELAHLVDRADDEVWMFLASRHRDIERMRLLHLDPQLDTWIERAALPLELDQRPSWLL